MPTRAQTPAVPRLTYLRIKNYRALRDVEFRDLTPLTVLIGPNGSGKSTVLDALDFLAEAVGGDLVHAWENKNRFRGMLTKGVEGDISFELEFGGLLKSKAVNYSLVIREVENRLIVISEKLVEKDRFGKPTRTFETESQNESNDSRFKVISRKSARGKTTKHPLGWGIGTEIDGISSGKAESKINFLSEIQNSMQETATSFRIAISSYRYIHLTKDHLKGYSDNGPREKLSPNGDNLPNVLYYLHTKHPAVLEKIAAQMRRVVPGLADIVPEITSDERLLLRFKDAQFEKPLPAQYMSGGTMRLAALLTLLYETDASGLLGIEEPENELHPQLLYRLAEEFEKAAEKRQLFITTHSPLLLDALDPKQVWVMYRGKDGYSHAVRTADMPNVPELVEDGSMLGYLWTSNTFTVGDPRTPFKANPDAR